MTSPLLVNTHLNRLHGRWQPSINTSTIREEDGNRHSTVYEPAAAEDDDDDDDTALGHLQQKNTMNEEDEEEVEEDIGDDDDEEEEDEEDEDDEDDEDDNEVSGEDDDSSTFTSSPSIPDENIDFDLVYTLHTFEATVEGQASVLKGDSLTLLDDSNSYWWLVKVLKTNEVGYIPAENIETPFERLARLNKHRNVEVTAIQHATQYSITNDKSTTSKTAFKQRKHVTMSKDIYYQSHIILLNDDNEEIEETYEEWEDDMVDDGSQSTMLASDKDEEISDTEMGHEGDEDEDDRVAEGDHGDKGGDGNYHNDNIGLVQVRGTSTDEEVYGLRITTPNSATANQGNGITEQSAPPAPPVLNDTKSATGSLYKKQVLPTTPLITTPTLSSSKATPTSGSIKSPLSSPKDDKDNKKSGGSFLRLFSRGKRSDGKKSSSLLSGTGHQQDASSSDQGSTNSSTISDELQQYQQQHQSSAGKVSTSTSNSSMVTMDPSATVLRVYAGNINVNATYNSVLVYDHTNAESLLRLAMDRFHISQIEGKSRGKRSSTSSPSQYPHQQHSSGVEYYLSVKPIDGDELTLLPQDKPLMIYQSLTAHLTTPMPSLSNIQQQITNMEFGRIGSPTNNSNKRTGTKYGEDAIRFYLHKRIRRVNERDGQLYVKVSLYHDDNAKRERKRTSSNSSANGNKHSNNNGNKSVSLENHAKNNSSTINTNITHGTLSSSSFSMRRKKSTSLSPKATKLIPSASNTSSATTASSSIATQSQIDKLIAVPAVATVADLIDISLEKFHLFQQPGHEASPPPRYRMTIVVNSQGPEKHLNPSSKLVEVLHDDTHAKNTTEKRFVLRKVLTNSSRTGHSSSNNNSNNKVAQEQRRSIKKQQQGEELDAKRSCSTTSPLLTPIPVMQLDTEMEMVLRRLERALMTYNRKQTAIDSVPPRLQLDPQQPKLAVMRNVNQGVDVYLPHGILRSKPLPPQQTQYVLMANDKNKESAWELVTQRVLPSSNVSPLSSPSTPIPTAPAVGAAPLSASPLIPLSSQQAPQLGSASCHQSGTELVSDSDLRVLIRFATQFLESTETAGGSSSASHGANTLRLLPNKDLVQPNSSLSSLDELERELQRIIASHTIS